MNSLKRIIVTGALFAHLWLPDLVSAQIFELSAKMGFGGSYLVRTSRNTESVGIPFGTPTEESFDAAWGFLVRIPSKNERFYFGFEPGFTPMGAGPTPSSPWGTEERPFVGKLALVTIPAFIGFRSTSFRFNPFISLGIGPHILLYSSRSEVPYTEVEVAIDQYKTLTAASYVDIGIRSKTARPFEFGLQWQRTLGAGYSDHSTYGFGELRAVYAQLYTRFALR